MREGKKKANKKQHTQLITQRMFLRSIVPAYKTTPTDALMVIAGTPALAYANERQAVSQKTQRDRWNFTELDRFVKGTRHSPSALEKIEVFLDFSSSERAVACTRRRAIKNRP